MGGNGKAAKRLLRSGPPDDAWAQDVRPSRAATDEPPICPACGVTMVPADLSAHGAEGDWVCLECEESDGDAG